MSNSFDKNGIIQKLSEHLAPCQILTDEKMSTHTTFKIGGKADLFIDINSEQELVETIRILEGKFFLVGNGSNLLVSDKGIRGAVIHMSRNFGTIEVKDNVLTCKAGATLAAIARCAYDHSLTGFEFAAGIPGSLGGAIVMNAGAYGGEMCQVVKSVRLMDYSGRIVTKSNEQMHFSYRHSLLKEEDYIVLEVEIVLEHGDKGVIKERMSELALSRKEKQPLEYPSAGSTFKRPPGYFAAKLIDEAGLRGYHIGDAEVSNKHCGFVVNKGNAKAKDVYKLIRHVQDKVMETSNVLIEPEVILVGEFPY